MKFKTLPVSGNSRFQSTAGETPGVNYTEYEFSSTAFYEKGIMRYDKILHVSEIL